MKAKWLGAAEAAVLGSMLSLGTVGCMVTAFDLPMAYGSWVYLTCGLWTLFCAGAFSWKRGGFLVLAAGVLLGGYLWKQGEFGEQFWQLIYRITHIYDRAYHWGFFRLVDTAWDAGTADQPMVLLGIILGTAETWAVCRREGPGIPILLALLPLLSCLVVTDTVPHPGFLYLLLLGGTLLLLTGQVRRRDARRGNYLTAMVAIPVALALGGLFLAMPREGYVSRAGDLRNRLTDWIGGTSDILGIITQEAVTTAGRQEPERVNLATLGNRRESTVPVLYVTAETGGPLYLRGQDYDGYDGKLWQTAPHRVEPLSYEGENLGYVVVETRWVQDQQYLPYYPRGGLSLIGGKYDNLRMEKTYSFVRVGLPGNWRELAAAGEQDRAALPFAAHQGTGGSEYLELPETTREPAAALLNPVLAGKTTTTEKAEAIAAFVRDSARYDKEPMRMPAEAEDFALWFLTEGESGYCIHFATAATVLLRAAGIRARYVSGYMLPAPAGETAAATGENAHAWAEYYDPGLETWLVLESTPAEGLPTQEEPSTAATEPPTTAPPSTFPPTEPEVTQDRSEPEFTVETMETARETLPETLPEQETPRWTFPMWLLEGALALAALVGTVGAQRRLRLWMGKFRRNRGDPNLRALYCWREAERLGRHLGVRPPDTLKALAQKAKFSQHAMTGEELRQLQSYLHTAKEELRQRPWYWQFLYRYVFALY